MKEHVQDELGLLLAGALEGRDLERVLDHLGECARCTRELALLQELEESLGTLGGRRRSWLVAAAVGAAACLMLLLLRPDRPERLARTSPLLLGDGSRVEALPVARLEALGLRRTRLLSGKARFTVVPGAAPFAVETLLGTVQVVGTVFTVEVSEADMNAKVPTAAAVVTVAVVSGVVFWRSGDGAPDRRIQVGEQAQIRAASIELKAAPPEKDAVSAERVLGFEKENEALKARIAQLSRENTALEARLALLGQENKALEARLALLGHAAIPAEAAPVASQAQAKSGDRAKLRISFGPADRLDKLASVDWTVAAQATKTLGPMIKEVLARVAAGEAIPPELGQQVQTQNANLVKVALAAAQAFPSHGGMMGSYTHPLVLANLMSNQLDLMGLSLTDDQAQTIVSMGNDYDSAYDTLQLGYGNQTLALEKIMDELDLKKASMAKIDAVLTGDQQAALFDPSTKDVMSFEEGAVFVMSDPYSPVLMFNHFAQTLGKTALPVLAKSVAATWVNAWALGDKDPSALASAFVTGLSLQAVPVASAGLWKLDDGIAAGRGTIQAMKDAVRTLALDPDAGAAIQNGTTFLVPRLTADK